MHTQLVGPSTITEKGVDLFCPAVRYIAEGQENNNMFKQTDMRKLAEKLEPKKNYWMGRRLCKEIAVGILDNVVRYMLSDMCQNIIMETVIPRALELVGSRSARRVRQSALKEAWIGRKVCQDILSGILNSIDTIMLFSICKDIITETILPETELRVETNIVLHRIEASTLMGL